MQVVCGVFFAGDRVLACRRAAHKAAAGKWEFPGGKVEHGENPQTALVREILEELGEEIEVHEHIVTASTLVDEQEIQLASFSAAFKFETSLTSTDHDEMVWIDIREIDDLDWALPDLPIIEALKRRLISGLT